MEKIRSTSKFRLMMLWTIICLSIFLFIVPNSAQAKKVFYPEAKPWETPEGRVCFEQWIREATAKMNAYSGSDDYNARKPWRINRYGILEGNPKYGPTSVYAPDNWSQYNANRYWYIWDYWHAPSGVWGKPDLNAARVPHIRPYIQNCLRKAGVGSVGTQQQATNSRCGQYARTAVAQNQENIRRRCGYTGARWSNNYKRHYDWCKGVSKAFADSETKAREDGLIKCRGGAGPATGAGGAITGHRAPFQTKSRDVVGRNEILRGDEINDWMFAISLRAEGTIKSITIRNTDGEFSVWDTKPNNRYWLLGVTTYDKRVLNKSDGSVYFNVSGRTDLYLLAADNGSSLRQGKTNYKVIIEFVDGRVLERNVGSASDQIPGTVRDIRWLTDRVWQFGRGDGSIISGKIRLRFGGKIEGYSHYNETRWGLEGNTLVFYDGSGKPTCRFTTARTVGGKIVLSGPFIPNPQRSHVLREVASQQPQSAQPPGIPGAQVTGAVGTQQQATNSRCDQYARTAVAQNQENTRRRCGYTGARWSNNYKSHYDWCKRVSKAFADSETKAREDGLIKCRGGAGPTTGAEVDWNNRPWLDPRVIRCVREYLDKWLVYVNQQRQRRNEPPFTRIDDWGRALRPPVITATGGIDGNWDNPTHFVWGDYNTIKHRNSPLGGVQDYVKDCVRRGGGGPGPGPPGPQPQPGTKPWETPEGRACFEQWIREATAKMNAYNGSDDYNARKPWRINRYGILEGNPKYGPTSAYAPDNWSQYNGNRYWYIWDYWHAPSGVWGKPDLNAAGVPHIRPYILRCIAGYQQAQPPPQPPPQQALLTARYTGINRDVVGRGGQATPNGEMDGQFKLRLDTRGFRRVVNFIMLQSANAQGQPTGSQVWDTKPNQYWILGVYRNGRRLNPRDQNVSDVVQGIVNYQIYGNDSGWFRPGQNFRITVRFADGGESVAYAKVTGRRPLSGGKPVTGTRPLAGVKPVPTPRDDETSPFDENYQQFIQTQTIRDETRTAGLQDQMAADMASSHTRDRDAFGTRLSDRLDEVHPSVQSPEEPTPHTDQGTESHDQASSGTSPPTGPSGGQGGTSTPERKCETVGLSSGSWRQLQNNRGPLSQGQGGLILHGDAWTNGKLKNGKFDGNGVESNKVFDLKNGGDVYMTFKVNDGGKYLAIFPKVFSEAGYKLLTTDHVWAGSIVVPNNTNLYAHINVDTNGKYKTTVCKGNYDDNGGSLISEYSGTLKNRTGRVRIRFVDNYAGVKAYLVILHAEVCAQDAAVTAVPTKPPTRIGCDTTTKQGGNKPETFIVELGQKSGTFVFKYNMYSVPDRMIVEYQGKKKFDTGCVGNKHGKGKGEGRKPITYSGASTKVTVKVLPSCEGSTTKWTFTANCPTKPPTTPKFRCKYNKDCWDHYKECNWYCKKKTGKCIPCRKNEHGKRDGTEDCCSGAKRYPNCLARD